MPSKDPPPTPTTESLLFAEANFQSGFFCAVVTKEISVSLW